MSVRLLKNKEMEGLVSVEELLDPMEEAYHEHGTGVAPDHPRERLYVPLDDRKYWFNNIMGAVPGSDSMALRIDSSHRIQREDRNVFVGDYTGLVLLFDIQSTDLKAIMDDHYLSPLRVAATSGVAARHLAPAGATRMGLFGTGEQAGPQLEVFQHLCDFDEIVVYSPTTEHRQEFAERYDDQSNADVRAVEDPRTVVEGSDVVVTATNSNEPVFDGEWLDPGTHVSTTVGGDYSNERDEIDATTIRRADRIYCNRFQQLLDDRQGNLYRLLDSGELTRADVAELGELVAGEAAARDSSEEITLMKNNCGMGLQFAVTASLIHERAENRDLGRELPQEWFVTSKDGEEWSP
jgi:ornithine cyclodeaminase